jgi:hypothetical protein
MYYAMRRTSNIISVAIVASVVGCTGGDDAAFNSTYESSKLGNDNALAKDVEFDAERRCIIFNRKFAGWKGKLCRGEVFDGSNVDDFEVTIPDKWTDTKLYISRYDSKDGTWKPDGYRTLGSITFTDRTPGTCYKIYCIGKPVTEETEITGNINDGVWASERNVLSFSYTFASVVDKPTTPEWQVSVEPSIETNPQMYTSLRSRAGEIRTRHLIKTGCVDSGDVQHLRYCVGDEVYVIGLSNDRSRRVWRSKKVEKITFSSMGQLLVRYTYQASDFDKKEIVEVAIDKTREAGNSAFSTNAAECSQFCVGDAAFQFDVFGPADYKIKARNDLGVIVTKVKDGVENTSDPHFSFVTYEQLKTAPLKSGCVDWKTGPLCVGDFVRTSSEPAERRAIGALDPAGKYIWLNRWFIPGSFMPKVQLTGGFFTTRPGACLIDSNVCVGATVLDSTGFKLGTVDGVNVTGDAEENFPKQIVLVRESGVAMRIPFSELGAYTFVKK